MRLLLSSLVPIEELKEILVNNLKTIRTGLKHKHINDSVGFMYQLTFDRLRLKYFKTKDIIITALIEQIVNL